MADECQQVPEYHVAAIQIYPTELQLFCTDEGFLRVILGEVEKLLPKVKVKRDQGLDGDNTRAYLLPLSSNQWVIISDWLMKRFATSGWEPFGVADRHLRLKRGSHSLP